MPAPSSAAPALLAPDAHVFVRPSLVEARDVVSRYRSAGAAVLAGSFGALDPETMHRAMACVLERVPTLRVIAHP